MSMRQYTVKMLKDLIKDLPDDMYVVTRTFEENWTSEGMFDGICPYITEKLWEIRTGFIPSDDQPCSYGEVLILSDFDDEDNLERWNNHVEELNLANIEVAKVWQPTMMLRNVERVISSSNYHCEKGLFLQQMWTSNLGDIEWKDIPIEIES